MIPVIYRPEYSAIWGNWCHHTPIILNALGHLNCENIIKSILNRKSICVLACVHPYFPWVDMTIGRITSVRPNCWPGKSMIMLVWLTVTIICYLIIGALLRRLGTLHYG